MTRLESLVACDRCERGIRPYGAFQHPDPLEDGLLCGACYHAEKWEHESRVREAEARRVADLAELESLRDRADRLAAKLEATE